MDTTNMNFSQKRNIRVVNIFYSLLWFMSPKSITKCMLLLLVLPEHNISVLIKVKSFVAQDWDSYSQTEKSRVCPCIGWLGTLFIFKLGDLKAVWKIGTINTYFIEYCSAKQFY